MGTKNKKIKAEAQLLNQFIAMANLELFRSRLFLFADAEVLKDFSFGGDGGGVADGVGGSGGLTVVDNTVDLMDCTSD